MSGLNDTLVRTTDHESESRVIATALLDSKLFAKLEDELSPEDFAHPPARKIYEIALRMRDRDGKVPQAHEITADLTHQVEDRTECSELVGVLNSELVDKSFDYYLDRVRDSVARRKAIAVAERLIRKAGTPSDYSWTDEVGELRENLPSKSAVFDWSLQRASDIWTDDPDEIEAMSAPPLIDGIVRRGELLLVVGGAKTWKTWMGIHMACAIDAGSEFLGTYPTCKANVLYLDYELKKDTLRKRVCMSFPKLPETVDLVSLRGRKRPSLAQLEALIVENGYDVVFVDCLYETGWIREENDNMMLAEDLRPIQEIAERTGCTIIIIDHTAKGGGKDKDIMDAARGGGVKGGKVDGVLQLVAYDGEEPGLVTVKTLVRDFPPAESFPVVRVQSNGTRLIIEPTDLRADAKADDRNGQKILNYLSNCNHATMAELKRGLSLSETPVRNALSALGEKVERVSDPSHKQRVLYRIPLAMTA